MVAPKGDASFSTPDPTGSRRAGLEATASNRNGNDEMDSRSMPCGTLRTCAASSPFAQLPMVPTSGGFEGGRGGWALSGLHEIPPDMDEASYLAGEKAAMFRLFQEVIPSQQAIGALSTAVHYLKAEVRELQQAHGNVTALQATMEGQKERLNGVEDQRIPSIEERIDHIQQQSCPQEMVSLLRSMHGLHTSAMAAHKAEVEWRQKSSLERLAISLKGLLSGSISQLDVALLFMSRRLLLGKYAESWMEAGSTDPQVAAHSRRRAVAGATLFVAAVELGWQAHKAGERTLPWPLQVFMKPMRPGLRLLRTACWMSVLVLGAHEARQYCLSLPFFMLPNGSGGGSGPQDPSGEVEDAGSRPLPLEGSPPPPSQAGTCASDIRTVLSDPALFTWLPKSLRGATWAL